jgi:predicted metal-dependent peptidase
MTDFPENLQAARYLASQYWPYIASGLWSLTPVETKGLGTLAVDKYWRLYYDPDLKWNVKGCATVLYHEINHMLRSHSERAELQVNVDTKAWNIAADAEINDDISAEKNCVWPLKPVTPKDLKMPNGLFAEEYYQKMPVVKVTMNDCGSCAGGEKRPHELDGPANAGGKSDVPGLSQGEGELLKRHIANEVRAEASRGNVPDHLKRWAEALLNPKLDWRKLLRSQVKHSLADIAGKVDYTYRHPARRNIPQIIMPSLRAPVPNVAIVLDTSGSISGDTLTSALSEANGVLRACGLRDSVPVYVTDAQVHSAKKVWNASQIKLEGGGGTDMRLGIDAAMRGRPKPHLVIVFTDGYTPWPASQPNCKLIIALVGNSVDAANCPSYAKVVQVDTK